MQRPERREEGPPDRTRRRHQTSTLRGIARGVARDEHAAPGVEGRRERCRPRRPQDPASEFLRPEAAGEDQRLGEGQPHPHGVGGHVAAAQASNLPERGPQRQSVPLLVERVKRGRVSMQSRRVRFGPVPA
jgi:hypothetical protein